MHSPSHPYQLLRVVILSFRMSLGCDDHVTTPILLSRSPNLPLSSPIPTPRVSLRSSGSRASRDGTRFRTSKYAFITSDAPSPWCAAGDRGRCSSLGPMDLGPQCRPFEPHCYRYDAHGERGSQPFAPRLLEGRLVWGGDQTAYEELRSRLDEMMSSKGSERQVPDRYRLNLPRSWQSATRGTNAWATAAMSSNPISRWQRGPGATMQTRLLDRQICAPRAECRRMVDVGPVDRQRSIAVSAAPRVYCWRCAATCTS